MHIAMRAGGNRGSCSGLGLRTGGTQPAHSGDPEAPPPRAAVFCAPDPSARDPSVCPRPLCPRAPPARPSAAPTLASARPFCPTHAAGLRAQHGRHDRDGGHGERLRARSPRLPRLDLPLRPHDPRRCLRRRGAGRRRAARHTGERVLDPDGVPHCGLRPAARLLQHDAHRLGPHRLGHRPGLRRLGRLRCTSRHGHDGLHVLRAVADAAEPLQDGGRDGLADPARAAALREYSDGRLGL